MAAGGEGGELTDVSEGRDMVCGKTGVAEGEMGNSVEGGGRMGVWRRGRGRYLGHATARKWGRDSSPYVLW